MLNKYCGYLDIIATSISSMVVQFVNASADANYASFDANVLTLT